MKFLTSIYFFSLILTSGSIEKEVLKGLIGKSKNNPDAFYELGQLYSRSESVFEKSTARIWYEKGAEAGHLKSMYALGHMFSSSIWKRHTKKEVFKWYKKAAEGGLPEAQYELGLIYLDPNSVKNNVNLGVSHIMKAADNDHEYALGKLADLYQNGKFLEKDIKQAIKCYEKLVVKKSKLFMYKYAVLLLAGDNELKPDHEKGLSIMIQAAEANGEMALRFLCDEYFTEDGLLKRDLNKALKWNKKAWSIGFPFAEEMIKKINQEIKLEKKYGPTKYSKEDLKKLLEIED